MANSVTVRSKMEKGAKWWVLEVEIAGVKFSTDAIVPDCGKGAAELTGLRVAHELNVELVITE